MSPVSLGEAVLVLTADLDRLDRDLGSAHTLTSSHLQRFGNACTGAGATMSLALTAPILAFGTLMATTTGDFESQMNILSTAARGSGTDLETLHSVALQMGQDTTLFGTSATTAATAMTNMYKAGLTTNEIFSDLQGYMAGTTPLVGALRSAIDLAASSELNLDEASDLVAVSMATFGLNADESARIVNSLVRTADASVSSVRELAESFRVAGPTAATFGWSLEDTNTALAILSSRGVTGADAGQALKSMMTNLMRPTDDVKEAMGRLNVTLYDANGRMRSLPDILGQLSRGFTGLTEEERNTDIQTLAGMRGMRAMQTLVTEGVPGWNAMSSAIGRAASAQEVAAARAQGFQFNLNLLKDSTQTLMVTAFEPFMRNHLTPLVQHLQAITSELMRTNPQFFDMAIKIALVLAAIGPVLLIIGTLATVLGALASPVGLIVLGIAALAAAFVASQGGILPAIQRLREFGETVRAFLQPIVATFSAFFMREFGIIKAWVDTNMPLIQSTITIVLSAVRAVWDAVWPYLSRVILIVWDSIKINIETTINVILGILRTIMLLINGDWQGAWEQIKATSLAALNGIWAFIQNIFNTILGYFGTSLEDLWIRFVTWHNNTNDLITGWFVWLWDTISEWLTSVWDSIIAWFQNIYDDLATFITSAGQALTTFWDDVQTLFNWATELIWSLIKAFFELITGAWLSFLDVILQLFGTNLQEIHDALWPWVEALQRFLENTWDWIKRTVAAALAAIQEGVTQFLAAVERFVTESLTLLSRTFETTWSTIKNTVLKIWDDTALALRTTWTTLSNWLTEQLGSLARLISNTWNGIQNTTSQMWASIRNTINAAWSGILDVSGSWLSGLSSQMDSWFNNIRSNILGIWQGLRDGISHMFDGIHISTPHISVQWQDLPVLGHIPSGVSVEWYAKGLDAIINGPMLIGVGEAGPERVQVTPVGKEKAQGNVTNWYLTANYRTVESEVSLRDTVRALQMVTR